MPAAGHPAVGVHCAIAQHFEVLPGARAGQLFRATSKGVGEARALDRALDIAVYLARLGDANHLHQRWHDVDTVVELRSRLAMVLDDLRPGDEHGVARATEMGSDLLGPLERRVAGPGPADRVVWRGSGHSPAVHEADRLLHGRLAA